MPETEDNAAALSPRLCAVGNALEQIRDTTLRQGALWMELDVVLQALDAVIDTLHAPRPDGAPARHVPAGEDTP